MIFFDERLSTFEMFSLQHLMAVLVILTIILLIVVFRKQLRKNQRLDKVLRIGTGILMISMEWIFYLWVILPGGFNLGLLPFGLCAISMYLTSITLFTDSDKLFKIVYPWAITGALLSLLIADQPYIFPHFRYLHYFGNHGMFLIANIYLVVVRGFRMYYKDLLKSSLVLFIISFILYFVNIFLSTNHMYLQELPSEVADMFMWLGSPWWVFGFGLGIFILFHLTYLPFLFINRKERLKRA
jgi:hypothetical integral membrane protein (TIGR02206 family)